MSSADPDHSRGRYLRASTFIVPSTGERVRKTFSLRDAIKAPQRNNAAERSPLLPGRRQHKPVTRAQNVIQTFQNHLAEAWKAVRSDTGQSILKCSLAYLLGSLATFIPAISNITGKGGSKHLVATVTIWFHPARTVGSMHEATMLAFIAFCYATFISFTSMGVAVFFSNYGMLDIGHAIILIVFCGGGLGFIAWVKELYGQPLVNLACALAALGCIKTLVSEGSIQMGAFSTQGMTQILVMLLLGIVVSTVVNTLVLPMTAKSRLHKDIAKSTDLQGEILVNITRAFLSGEEPILEEGQQIFKDNVACLSSMSKNMNEAQKEYYVQGFETQYSIEAKLVKCLARLSQDLGGLRSAASTQFSILGGRFGGDINLSAMRNTSAPKPAKPTRPVKSTSMRSVSRAAMLGAIPEESGEPSTIPQRVESPEAASAGATPASSNSSFFFAPSDSQRLISSIEKGSTSPADMFVAFISQLGPPAKSLAYTIKQILDVAPFRKDGSVSINEHFHPSLERAIDLYKQSRKEALETLYRSRALTIQRSTEVVADLEEVAASCGHFSFSLLDFAEDCLDYLQTLDELKAEIELTPRRRSWKWMLFWRQKSIDHHVEDTIANHHEHDENGDPQTVLPPSLRKIEKSAGKRQFEQDKPWTFRLYRAMRILRRDDVEFSIKVGIGAILYASPAFLPATRPTFSKFHGEWGLVSYMVVCAMTIGASNSTGIQRFLGTTIGAFSAVLCWFASNKDGVANPFLLAFLGWLVAGGCYYIILALDKAPMGRFTLMTYNLTALWAYSLSIKDQDNSDDQGGVDPAIWAIVFHRVISVFAGTFWGIFVTRFIWPISARKKFQNGMCVLWIRMSLIWKRDPLAMFLLGVPKSSYMDIREEAELNSFLTYLDTLRKAAKSEFELRGPFPDEIYGRIVSRTRQMLESFHAMNVVISKQLQCSDGEAAVLKLTRDERFALSARISHLFSVLASSLKLEYPLNDVLPTIEDKRNKLLTVLFEFRRTHDEISETDYELFYAYLLVTGQLAQDIEAVIREIENLFGTLDEENLKLH